METDQTKMALSKLNDYKENKLTLVNPVFFVPGLTDENCGCWINSDSRKCMKDYLNEVVKNPEQVYFIDFTKESESCESFIDFGNFLKEKIWTAIGRNQSFSLVGHSMGGLDIRAALTQGEALLNCDLCITVATPHCGDNLGGVLSFLINRYNNFVQKIKPVTDYQVKQAKYLDPNYKPVKMINSVENRTLFLNRVNKFYELKGKRDGIVQGSAFINKKGIEVLYKEKADDISILGCDHVGLKGITMDPQVVVTIIQMLCDKNFTLARNRGNFSGGVYKPPQEDKFV